MASTIKIKNSSTAGAVPTSSDLVQGELAINVTDRRIFTENASGTVVELGTPSIDDNGNATAITIDSSENVGIGTSSPTQKLDVAGASPVVKISRASGSQPRLGFGATSGEDFYVEGSSATGLMSYSAGLSAAWGGKHVFLTDTVERMRIDSSGNVMMGVTGSINGNTKFSFENANASLNTGWFHNSNASNTGSIIVGSATRTASSSFYFIDCGANFPTSFARQFAVTGAGVIYAQNTSVQSLSDVRTKENVRDADDGLDVIMGVRPVRFDFKEGFGNDRKNVLGFIAQEIETVFPDAVEQLPVDPDGEGPEEPYKSVGPAALIPVLVKAIQEQQALITQLQADVAALKGQA